MAKRTLAQVLDNENINDIENVNQEEQSLINEEEENVNTLPVEGMCIECADQPASVYCEQCGDDYCSICFEYIHRKGTRKLHKTKPIKKEEFLLNQNDKNAQHMDLSEQEEEEEEKSASTIGSIYYTSSSIPSPAQLSNPKTETENQFCSNASVPKSLVSRPAMNFAERAKYIPLRLSLKERKQLRLLEATMNVSEYTDKIDIISYKSKVNRINVQVRDICAILSGLLIASDYTAGQKLLKDKNFAENASLFQHIFEVGRRHKIMNPEKMRSEYGKLIYMLMDTQLTEVQELLGFSCVKDIEMVYNILNDNNAVAMLSDEVIMLATMEIIAEGKTRYEVQREIKQKEKAIEYLSRKYANIQISQDELKTCLYSIGDNNAFLRQSRDSCDKMIQYLTTMFSPKQIEEGYSLAIRAGFGGHRLTHNHETQYNYILQSLTLWREVLNDMFKLWYLCEQDLLDTGRSPYRLRDTGQGLNRVQSCPRIGKAMHHILYKVQKSVGDWVGSSVIHLGDHNVPNALMFIDKYAQVPRILNPIVIALGQIDGLMNDKYIASYINKAFNGPQALKKEILCDFFKYGFDGSGADNFMDAGSCVDGRLTSAWNWCSQIEKKSYFPVFLLTGFTGFDGKFA